MSAGTRAAPRLDVRALPSLTTVEAAMIVALVTGALVLIQVGAPSMAMWPAVLVYLFVGLRSFLAIPERMARRHQLAPPPEDVAPLQRRIDRLARDLALPRSPTLVVSPDDAGLATFGTVRRWYLWCGLERARALASRGEHDRSLDAALLHELCHFQHGDHLRIGAARAAVVAGAAVLAWCALFFFGLLTVVHVTQDYWTQTPPSEALGGILDAWRSRGVLVPPVPLEALDEQFDWEGKTRLVADFSLARKALTLWSNTIPVALLAASLMLLSWRRLLRVREHYADAGAACQLGDGGPVVAAVIGLGGRTTPGRRTLGRRVGHVLRPVFAWAGANHPTAQERLRVLRDPRRMIASPWRMAVYIAVFLLIQELLLQGTSAVMVAGRAPLQASAVAAYLLISTHGLLRAAAGSYRHRQTLAMVAIAFVPLAALTTLTILVLLVWAAVDPAGLAAALDHTLAVSGGHTGRAPLGAFEGSPMGFVVHAAVINLGLLVVVLVVVGCASILTVQLFRGQLRAGTDGPAGRRVLHRTYGLLAVTAIAITLGVLAPASAVLELDTERLTSPLMWTLSVLSLLGWAGVAAAQVLTRGDRGRCPDCGEALPATPGPSVRCAACDTETVGWPWIRYRVEAM